MRTLALTLALVLGGTLVAGCESTSTPSRAARTEVGAASPAATTAATAPGAATGETAMGSCGGQCGGMSCGGMQCGGAGGCMKATEPTFASVPGDAHWTSLHVTGMHCGGCAKRIKNALAGVDGVLSVEVDLGKAEVRVATAAGKDLPTSVPGTIDGLGYKVQTN